MEADGDEARDVGKIDQERRADLRGDLAKRLVLHHAGIRARAGNDQFRLMFASQRSNFVEID